MAFSPRGDSKQCPKRISHVLIIREIIPHGKNKLVNRDINAETSMMKEFATHSIFELSGS
jgi:hypothetical protein